MAENRNGGKIARLAEMIKTAHKIVVFSGAGISTESGIPDFRSPGGIWSRFAPSDFTIDKYLSDAQSRDRQWRFLLNNPEIRAASPNDAHLAVARLEGMGKVLAVITQNIDGLHQRAGSTPDKVYELHGNLDKIVCLDCSKYFPTDELAARWANSPSLPACEACGGLLKPAVVLFGEALPAEILSAATYLVREADLLLVIGSSLVVYPAAFLPSYAHSAGARVAIVNLGKTSFDEEADLLINDYAGRVMREAIDLLENYYY